MASNITKCPPLDAIYAYKVSMAYSHCVIHNDMRRLVSGKAVPPKKGVSFVEEVLANPLPLFFRKITPLYDGRSNSQEHLRSLKM